MNQRLRPRTRKQWVLAVTAGLLGLCVLCSFLGSLLPDTPATPSAVERAAVVAPSGGATSVAMARATATATPELPTATPELPTATPEPPTATPTPIAVLGGREAAVVMRIVDGDTIHVSLDGDEETVRYIGMDTPETNSAGGDEATAANASLVEGQTVYLERDTSERDRYGRLLRYVYLADGRMVNEELVRSGNAVSIAYPPDTAHQLLFDAAQLQAQAAGAGMWSAAWATSNANLRTGPGTGYDVAGTAAANRPLQIVAINPDGDWYQVANGAWIAAFLVANAPGGVPVATVAAPATPTAAAPATPAAVPTRASDPTPVVASSSLQGIHLLVIQNVSTFEILEIRNTSANAVDISGWVLYGSRGDDRCIIPAGVVLPPGGGYQIATGDSQPPANGYKCGDRPIWNNQGEIIYLSTPDGQTIQIRT